MTVTTDTKNALGIGDNTRQIVFKRVSEKVQLEENSTVVEFDTYGDSWIVGSSTNGIVGANTSTQGGGQQVVGSSGRVNTVLSVVNINNKFREYFKDTSFEDTSTTTADWADTVGQIDFTVGEIAQSLSTYLDTANVVAATLTVDDDTNLTLQLSADGGSNWETVTNETEHAFTNTGNDLRFKFTATGNATVTSVRIKYR